MFQPHLYSRTKLLFNEFARGFSDADTIIVAPIYAAREKNDPRVSMLALAAAIRKTGKDARAFKNFEEINKFLKSKIGKKDVVFTMGAGDVYRVGEMLMRS